MWDTVDTEHRTVATATGFVFGYAGIVAYMHVLHIFYAKNRHSLAVPIYQDTIPRIEDFIVQLPVNF